MNFDIARKTELIRRKIKTIIFDKKNRNLSDKMYDELGKFFEKLNKEGVNLPEKYYEKINDRLDKLYELNTKRFDELNKELDDELARSDKILNNAYQRLDINQKK